VVTATVTGPMVVPGGTTAVMWVSELTVNEVAGTPPKVTEVEPVRLVPVMMTVVPPASGPPLGVMVVRVGGLQQQVKQQQKMGLHTGMQHVG
jgi:hypothetical protein